MEVHICLRILVLIKDYGLWWICLFWCLIYVLLQWTFECLISVRKYIIYASLFRLGIWPHSSFTKLLLYNRFRRSNVTGFLKYMFFFIKKNYGEVYFWALEGYMFRMLIYLKSMFGVSWMVKSFLVFQVSQKIRC